MIETLFAAFAFGTFWFWLLAAISTVIIITSIEHEHYPTPSIVAILLGVIYWKDIVAAPWQVIALVVGLFALIGVLWSTFKWFRHVNTMVAKYKEQYGDTLTESKMESLRDDISVSQHKAMITAWIMFWPWSLIWSLTGDIINTLYDSMVHIYQKITNRGLNQFKVEVKPTDTERRGR